MIVDTSAIVAIALAEPQAPALLEVLTHSSSPKIGAPTYVEIMAVLGSRDRPELERHVQRLFDAVGIEIVAFESVHAAAAAAAYRDYGKGSGHPARLNLGDSYSYALAAVTNEPLLFVGDDFFQTDIPAVPLPTE